MTREATRGHAVGRKTSMLLTLLAMLVAGIVYEYVGEVLDARSHPPVGRVVDVAGRRMHVFAKGEGTPTVVFAAGWKIPSSYVDFYPLWSEVSKHTRTVVYDRPGYGWSEVTGASRDIDGITKEVHQLLRMSGERPPYVLVGHSIGSLEVLRFAQMYPDEVKGIVLIDGSNPDMYSNMPPPSTLVTARVWATNWAIYLANRTGLTRLIFSMGLYSRTPLSTARNDMTSAPQAFKGLDAALFLRTFNNRNHIDEGNNKELNASRVARMGHLHVPLMIVTSQQLRGFSDAWRNQVGLKAWSAQSKQIVVEDSGHAVHWDNPGAVNREILAVLGKGADRSGGR